MPRTVELYWKKIETAPEGTVALLRVTDDGAADYNIAVSVQAHEGRAGERGFRQAIGGAPHLLEAI
jgi:hypothetical protein